MTTPDSGEAGRLVSSDALRHHLERAMAEATDPEVRFHLRQALQLLS